MREPPDDESLVRMLNENVAKDLDAIARAFTYHPAPDGRIAEKYEKLREAFRQLAILVALACPESREKAIAMTNLEQSNMWANAAIARNSHVK